MFGEFINEGIPPLIFWPFVAAAIIIQGISKSGFAGGVGVLSIPLMMLVMPVDKVVASLLPLLILLDANALYHHWHNKVWRRVVEIYVPSVVGIAIGGLVWWRVGQEGIELYGVHIKRFVGVVAIVFGLYIIFEKRTAKWTGRLKTADPETIRFNASWPFGLVGGFTSAIAHSAGPIVSFYLFAQGMGKTLFVGTAAWTFTLINLTKLPFFIAAGLIDGDILLFGLVLVWLIPIGSYLGKWMHDRVSEERFNRIICVLVLLAGIQLVSNVNFILLGLEALVRR